MEKVKKILVSAIVSVLSFFVYCPTAVSQVSIYDESELTEGEMASSYQELMASSYQEMMAESIENSFMEKYYYAMIIGGVIMIIAVVVIFSQTTKKKKRRRRKKRYW